MHTSTPPVAPTPPLSLNIPPLPLTILPFPCCAQEQVVVVTRALVELVLGPPKYSPAEALERVAGPGTAAGLVWTAVGGGVQYIECAKVGPGTPDK